MDRGVTHLHIGVLLSSKKNNDILKFVCKWIELETIILSKVTETQKDKRSMYSLVSGY